MSKRISSFFTVAVLCGLIGLAGGCHSMDGGSGTAMTDKGVVALSNHGSVVFLPTTTGDAIAMSTSGDPVCKQCQMDAAEYFKTGKMTEKCSVCGASRVALMHGH